MKRYFLIACSLLLCLSCSKGEDEVILKEDYDKLFPFGEIDKPSPKYGQVIERQGDTRLTAKTFQYQGTKSELFETEYDVVVTYEMHEEENDEGIVKSRYALRFVNADEKLISIGSDPERNYMTSEEYDALENKDDLPEAKYTMPTDEEQTIRFKVKSGFQMLLCLTGTGPTTSWVKAEIVATAVDGSIPPIKLSTGKQVQTLEGIAMLPSPFCKYVILP